MNRWLYLLCAVGSIFLVASSAQAITLRLVVPGPLQFVYAPGDSFDVQLYLDTQGETAVTSVFASVYADPSTLGYVGGTSPGAILVNGSTYEALARLTQPTAGLGGDPPGIVHAASFATTNSAGTGVADSNELLATLTFVVVAPGFLDLYPVLNTSQDLVTVSQVDVTSSVNLVVTPEASVALLSGLGLMGLGWVGRRRRS